jgi:hypothetical protein
MHSMLRIRWVPLLIAMLVMLVVRPAGAASSSPFTCGGWSVVASPSPFTESYLSGVAAASPTDAWAVGVGYNARTPIQTLIEHWNGSSWQLVSSSTQGSLNAVTALSEDDVWAVGYTGNFNGPAKTLIKHWDGTMWEAVKSPNTRDNFNGLASVAAVSPSDIWAVGSSGVSSGDFPHALIEHWNGSKWSIVPAADLGSDYSELTSVTAISSTDAWAVGYTLKNHYALLTEHWNGSKWSVVKAVPSHQTYQIFTSVTAINASDVWAVGVAGDSAKILLENWNGRTWNVVQGPANPQFASFYGIAAASATNVWAVGGTVPTGTIHWDGMKWSFVSSPNGPYSDNVLSGVAVVSARSVWAVGSSGDSSLDVYATLIEHYC